MLEQVSKMVWGWVMIELCPIERAMVVAPCSSEASQLNLELEKQMKMALLKALPVLHYSKPTSCLI